MGIEAFILPWLVAMSMVAAAGIISLARRFGLMPPASRFVPPSERDAPFWTRQAIKAAIVGFATWQIVIILMRVI